jgi:hypothetical protein
MFFFYLLASSNDGEFTAYVLIGVLFGVALSTSFHSC